MEVAVYGSLLSDPMNQALVNVTDGTKQPVFTKANWEKSITGAPDQASMDAFNNLGWSNAANSWGGEYNGLSSIQDPTTGYKYMKSFLRSCASMQTGPDNVGLARVGLYTIGFMPETWLQGPAY